MDFTLDINTLVGVGVVLILAVIGAAWRVGRTTGGLEKSVGGLEQSVTESARTSSETHERLGNAIAEVGRRVDETRNELRVDSQKLDERLSANHRELSGDVKRILECLPPADRLGS